MRRKLILLVEDEAIIALAQARKVESFGYESLIADNGEDALRFTTEEDRDIDLVLMDVDLGRGMDGPETARRILERRTIPVLFLTSHAERETVEKVRGIARYGYVIKDSGDFVLRSSIEMAFELFSAHELMRLSEERYRRITAAVMDYFFTVYVEDGKATRTEHGSACIGVTGYSAEEFAADPYLWYDMIFPEDRDLVAKQAADILGGSEPGAFLHRIRRKDGELRWIANTPVIHRDPGGKLLSYDGLIRDITERKLAEDRIKALLDEKELLLREVHHRIKNNMNTMMGLLSLQADLAVDRSAALALQNAQGRLQSMGLLYDKLYRSENMRELSLKEYLPALVDEIVRLFPNGGIVRTEARVDDFPLGIKQLSSLGIMVNELVTNIMKYAFKDRNAGLIRVFASIEGRRVSIVIEDDGVGLPETVDLDHSSGFGLQLVGMLAGQLGGSIGVERGRGTKFSIEFLTAD